MALASDAAIVLTLVLLEAVLSFDNAAILTVLSRRLHDPRERRRALNFGLLIAYGLRVAAIFAAVLLVRQPVFLVLGGLYLVVLGVKHFASLAKGNDEHTAMERKPLLARLGIGAFAAIVLEIGVIDLVFALDQVVAAVGFVRGHEHATVLIIIAASLGLLSLRLLAPVIGRLMDWLPLLEHMAFVAVTFVGTLMLLEHTSLADGFQLIGNPDDPAAPAPLFHLEKSIKIAITLALFLVPVLLKLVFRIPRSHPGVHAAVETDFAPDAAHRSEDVAQGDPQHPGGKT